MRRLLRFTRQTVLRQLVESTIPALHRGGLQSLSPPRAGTPRASTMSKDKKDEKDSMGKLEELFLKSRTIMLYGEINQKVAREFCTKLQLLASESDDDITVYINSPGGHVESGDSIHDMIRFVKPRVKVVGTGWVASAGALIYAAPPVENRYSLPNTRYMLHQPAAASAAKHRTSASRRTRSSRCANGSTRFSPTKPASRSRRSPRTRTATFG